MGLFTALVTLPLAPVRGTVWIAEKLREQAEREADPGEQLRFRLEALQVDYELGVLTDDEYERAEQELLDEYDLLQADDEDQHREDESGR